MSRSCVKVLNKRILQKQKWSSLDYNTRYSYATEAKFQTFLPFRLHQLTEGPSTEVTLTQDDALVTYKLMSTIRRMEATAGDMYQSKIIRGFCHLYAGQEAVAVGIKAALRENDTAISSYRNHAWAYLFDGGLTCVLSELTGRKSGCSRGKGGSMHMYAKNFYGGQAIVGAQVPIGVGIALAHKYNNTDSVCVTIYGDGAANQGQVFEAFNMAKMWSLPCIFLCENNLYSMGTSVKRSTAHGEFYKKGDVIPGVWMDGMDVLAVREAARFAVNLCSSGNGPIILEAETYRYSGHSMSDPGTTYRSREEIQKVRETKDPIATFRERIINGNLVTAEQLKEIDKTIKKTVDELTAIAKADKEIGLEELTSDIYADDTIKEVRGTSPFDIMQHKYSGRAQNLK